MTSTEIIIKQLSIRLLKSEIAARNPVDPKAVEDLIAPRVRIDGVGNVYVVDKAGNREDNKSFEQFLDQVVKDRPDLWKNGPASSGGSKGNPFAKGPNYSVTKQMILIQSDPDTAEKLAEEAGQAPIWRR